MCIRFRYLLAVALFVLAVTPQGFAADRIALVIGNDDYQALPVLKKAVNDARAVAATLREIGFDVVIGENLSRRQMSRTLAHFTDKIKAGDQAFVFFAGHGITIGAENYLIPSDMPKPASGQIDVVRDDAFSVDLLLSRVRARDARSTIFILDACRNNPFAATGVRSIGGQRGLTRVTAPDGVFVLFSAGTGQTALDQLSDTDSNPNSVFTRKLVPLLKKPGLTHVRLAKRLQRDVSALARTVQHEQQPAYYDQIIGEIVLHPGSPARQERDGTQRPSPDANEAAQAWKAVENSKSSAVLNAFIKNFPKSVYAEFAKARRNEIKTARTKVGVNPGKPGCTVYRVPNYNGSSAFIGPNTRLEELEGPWDNKISSVRVGGACRLVAYQKRQLGGASLSFGKSTPALDIHWNNKISSIRCVCRR